MVRVWGQLIAVLFLVLLLVIAVGTMFLVSSQRPSPSAVGRISVSSAGSPYYALVTPFGFGRIEQALGFLGITRGSQVLIEELGKDAVTEVMLSGILVRLAARPQKILVAFDEQRRETASFSLQKTIDNTLAINVYVASKRWGATGLFVETLAHALCTARHGLLKRRPPCTTDVAAMLTGPRLLPTVWLLPRL